MSELITARLRAHALKLGLSHLAESVEVLLARPEDDQSGYLQLLDLMLEDEVGVREGRRFRNALNLSGLPHRKNLDDFDFSFQPARFRTLASLSFVTDHRNVVFLSPPGVGVACQREGTRVLPRPWDHLGRMVMVMSAPRLVNQDTPVGWPAEVGWGRCCRR